MSLASSFIGAIATHGYYTHAWGLYLVLMIIYTLRPLNVNFPFSNYGLEPGAMIEAVLLSFALGDRIRLLQKEQKQYSLVQRDLAMATEIQKYLFPQSKPVLSSLDKNGGEPEKPPYYVVGKYLPSASLSGDFYDYLTDNSKNLYLLIVDVAGHGYSAGQVASMIKVAFRETLKQKSSVSNHQNEINRILCDNVSSTFATAMNIRVEPSEKKLSLVCSGHMPLMHFKAKEKELVEYRPPGLPLGISREYECELTEINYNSGDRLVIFTDGIVEELNSFGEEYSMKRFKDQIYKNVDVSAERFADRLLTDIVNWKNNSDQEDDITFVIIDLN